MVKGAMDKMNDIELTGLVQGGDADALECLVARHYMLMYRVAYRFCGVREDAEDIAQEVAVKLARVIMSYKHASSFRTWLYRVVVNAARDYIRKHAGRRTREEDYLKDQPPASSAGLNGTANDEHPAGNPGISSEGLMEHVRKLPDKYRDALLLVHGEGLNHREAGEALGCAESTVSWRVHEAKKKLKELLNQKE